MKVKQDKLIKLINNNNSFHTIINRAFLNNQQIKHHHIVFLNCRQKLNHIFDIKMIYIYIFGLLLVFAIAKFLWNMVFNPKSPSAL